MRLIENYIARAEQILNPIDWIPYVSSFSGMVRILASTVEVVAGAALAALKVIQMMLTSRRRYWDAVAGGLVYSMHGMGNMARGALAVVPGLNCLLFIHDKYLGRMNYPTETLRPGVYPLINAYKFA